MLRFSHPRTLSWLLLLFCWWVAPLPVVVQAQVPTEPKKLRPIGKKEMLALFRKGETIEERTVQGSDIIEIIKEDPHVAISIRHSIIEGKMKFLTLPKISRDTIELPKCWSDEQKEKWRETRNTQLVVIANTITINDTEIMPPSAFGENSEPSAVDAEDVFFNSRVSFSGTTFNGTVDFSDATFVDKASFSEAMFKGSTNFTDAVFAGEADFVAVTFRADVLFTVATFLKGGARFNRATFQGVAGFPGTVFNSETRFDEAVFFKLAYFREARFVESLTLALTRFQSFADLRDTEIGNLSSKNLVPLIVEGRCDFRDANILEAHLENIIFAADVDFSDVTFGLGENSTPDRPTIFRFVTFESNTYFLRARFAGYTSFERVNFQKELDFTDAEFLKKSESNSFSLSYLRFSNLRLSFDQLPSPEVWVKEDERRIGGEGVFSIGLGRQELQPISKVLKGLEQHFQRQGQLEDENDAYYHFKRTEFEEARVKREWSWEWFKLKTQQIFWGWPFAYGTGFWRAMAWTFGLNLLFALIYSTAGTLHREEESFATRDFVLKVRLLDYYKYYLPKGENHAVQLVDAGGVPAPHSSSGSAFWTFWNALWLSTALLFKLGFRDTTVSGRVWGIDLRYVVLVEWLFGFAVVVGLTITLANTQPLLNNLVKGLL